MNHSNLHKPRNSVGDSHHHQRYVCAVFNTLYLISLKRGSTQNSVLQFHRNAAFKATITRNKPRKFFFRELRQFSLKLFTSCTWGRHLHKQLIFFVNFGLAVNQILKLDRHVGEMCEKRLRNFRKYVGTR